MTARDPIDALPAIPDGHRRQWLRCQKCKWVGYYDYLPYSLSNPIKVLGCGHHGTAEMICTEATAASGGTKT